MPFTRVAAPVVYRDHLARLIRLMRSKNFTFTQPLVAPAAPVVSITSNFQFSGSPSYPWLAPRLIFSLNFLDDTLVIVTADHSHTFVLGGYVDRGNPIFGFQSRYEVLSDGKPALSLSYADGPGGLQDG